MAASRAFICVPFWLLPLPLCSIDLLLNSSPAQRNGRQGFRIHSPTFGLAARLGSHQLSDARRLGSGAW